LGDGLGNAAGDALTHNCREYLHKCVEKTLFARQHFLCGVCRED
jgi:hypothetical protein